jgi:hypothetical protein
VIECADRKWNRASRKMFDAHEKVWEVIDTEILTLENQHIWAVLLRSEKEILFEAEAA